MNLTALPAKQKPPLPLREGKGEGASSVEDRGRLPSPGPSRKGRGGRATRGFIHEGSAPSVATDTAGGSHVGAFALPIASVTPDAPDHQHVA